MPVLDDPFASAEHEEADSISDGIGYGDNGSSDDLMSGEIMESKELDIKKEQAALNEALAKKENRAIRVLRIVVLLVLITAAVVASVVVFLFLKRSEENEFDNQFYDLASRLIDGVLANAKTRVQVLDMYAISLTASALATNQTWPYVTFRDFEARSTAMRVIVESDFVGLYPYVQRENRRAWEEYTLENTAWMNDSFAYQQEFKSIHNRTVGVRAPARRNLQTLSDWDFDRNDGGGRFLQTEDGEELVDDDIRGDEIRNATFDGPGGISPEIYRYGTEEEDFLFVVDDSPGPYYPMWQVSPAREYTAIDVNYNINDPFYAPAFTQALDVVQTTSTAVFTGVWNVLDDGTFDMEDDYDFREVPAAAVFFPVFDKIQGEKEVVGIIELDFEFGPLMSSVLPPFSNSLICVISNPCNQMYTYEVTGERSTYLGPEDLHESKFNSMKLSALMTDFDKNDFGKTYNGPSVNKDWCPWKIEVYATKDLENEFLTDKPIYYMLVVLAVFVFVSVVFVIYDILVEMRQKKLLSGAVKSDRIVASFFPKEFRDRLYEENKEKAKSKAKKQKAELHFLTGSSAIQTESVRNFLMADTNAMPIQNSPPIAELYQDCTVFFGDLAGFTNWSSSRSPSQVFTLLETLYASFDKLARKHGVFKVETIGDCYLCVTGLPEPQADHALRMVKFARECLERMRKLSKRLESTLGPDTGSLGLRVGLHSGPVTAGILRGGKARFQLFGDTVNTASRMESLGLKHFIHVSQETADILNSVGKGNWLQKREDKVVAKGKGELQTYFVYAVSGAKSIDYSSSGEGSSTVGDDDQVEVELALSKMFGTEDTKINWAERHHSGVGWAAELLTDELRKIVAERDEGPSSAIPAEAWSKQMKVATKNTKWDDELVDALAAVDDGTKVRNSIARGRTSIRASARSFDFKRAALDHEVERQVVEFVTKLGYSYRQEWGFEHACYVIMAADKMADQLCSLSGVIFALKPWARFAILLTALIRDVDAPPTPEVVETDSGKTFMSVKSVIEQRSLDMAWSLLAEENFKGLRETLCSSNEELNNFWQLVVNLFLATDISNSSISENRKKRWEDTFDNRKGTASFNQAIIASLEHVMLVAYQAHYFQHWETFTKWNDLLYNECMGAFKEGLLSKNPETYWHQSVLVHYDDFLLPTLKEMDLRGVLGAVGTENFKVASQNRQEWALSQESNGPNAPTTEATPNYFDC